MASWDIHVAVPFHDALDQVDKLTMYIRTPMH